MGMGEPLANYSRVLGAVRRLTDPAPDGLGISQRGITVSTVGLVPAIQQAGGREPVGPAGRLPARPRRRPARRAGAGEPALAGGRGAGRGVGLRRRDGRRVSIEYALIRDINDQAWRADALARLLAGRLAHVNLIPLNPTPGSKWTASRPEDMAEFEARLAAAGVPVTIRDTRGSEIDGACGQLAAAGQPGGSPGALGRRRLAGPAGRALAAAALRRRAPGPRSSGLLQAAWRAAQDAGAVTAGTRAGAQVRRVRPRVPDRLPARLGVRRGVDRDRRPDHDRRARHHLRGHAARPRPWARPRCCGWATAA